MTRRPPAPPLYASAHAALAAWAALALCPSGPRAQCQPEWSAQTQGVTYAFATHDEDGPGPIPPALYLGDVNLDVGGVVCEHMARFDGWGWSSVGPGLGGAWSSLPVKVLLDAPEVGAGLFAGGEFDRSGRRRVSEGIADWHAGAWHSVGGGVRGYLLAMAAFDEDAAGPIPPYLLVGGPTVGMGGDPAVRGIGRWDGTRYSRLGEGLLVGGGMAGWAHSLAAFDEDGPGPGSPALFVGGEFYEAGSVEALFIARWDGSEWSAVGQPGTVGTTGSVLALQVFDEDGPGPRAPMLFVGGAYSKIGSPENWWLIARGLARWDGVQWSTLPEFAGSPQCMTVHDDDGPGPNRPALFLGGLAFSLNGQPVGNIAKWDGERWHTLGSGVSGFVGKVVALGGFDEDGAGPNPGGLYVGGDFTHAGGLWSPGLARWGCPLPPRCYADCDQSTGVGALDVFDFICFQNRFAIADPTACDCDAGTGFRVCDVFDFLCFQNAFAAGCP